MNERQSQLKVRGGGGVFADPVSWQGILNIMPAGAYTCDAAGLITYFNPLAGAVWGRTPKLRDPADRYCGAYKLYSSNGAPIPHDECWMALALREGKNYNGREIQIEQPDGNRVFAMAYAYPLRDSQDQIIGAVNFLVATTAQKEIEYYPIKTRSSVSRHYAFVLAAIEGAASSLAGMIWETSAFS